MTLTIEQRDRLLAILPHYEQKAVGRKRADIIQVFLGILWVLESGARWEDIDKRKYASFQTCHRYFQEWVQNGVFEQALTALVQEGEKQGQIKIHESFVDGSFVRSKKGAMRSGTATRATAVG
jgi:transposase